MSPELLGPDGAPLEPDEAPATSEVATELAQAAAVQRAEAMSPTEQIEHLRDRGFKVGGKADVKRIKRATARQRVEGQAAQQRNFATRRAALRTGAIGPAQHAVWKLQDRHRCEDDMVEAIRLTDEDHWPRLGLEADEYAPVDSAGYVVGRLNVEPLEADEATRALMRKAVEAFMGAQREGADA